MPPNNALNLTPAQPGWQGGAGWSEVLEARGLCCRTMKNLAAVPEQNAGTAPCAPAAGLGGAPARSSSLACAASWLC